MKNQILLVLLAACVITTSCKKGVSDSPTDPQTPPAQETPIAPAGFNFVTSKNVDLDVKLLTNTNEPIGKVLVKISRPDNGSILYSAITDANGSVHATINIPSYLDTLVVDPNYVGLLRNAKAYISNNRINCTIGGVNGYEGNLSGSVSTSEHDGIMSSTTISNSTIYSPMGSWDNNGVPTNKEPALDAISGELLSFINASLPERYDVPTYHPSFIAQNAETDLKVIETGDVWVTFVSEGAGNLNSLGFFTYATNTPPASAAAIDSIHYIFPNASLPGSGGNLTSGTKVKLGHFNAGTSIGFVLLANAWSGSSINVNSSKYYSYYKLNPETDDNLKRHTVLLNDTKHNLLLIGFEDLNRSSSSCDNDFNDLVMYATANPVTAISTSNVQNIEVPVDTDGDGVLNSIDQFPYDATRAYINYYPAKNTRGTLSFEDLWPGTGDYDMNDLVVGYYYSFINNASNKTVEMYADYNIKGVGAYFNNGFGVQLPFSPSIVSTVTGQRLIGNYIHSGSNGTEAGQSKTVIIPFDDYRALFNNQALSVNIQNGTPYVTSDTAHVYIKFTSPISSTTLGSGPYNPFLISNGRRGYEVHLPGNAATDLADKNLFGTEYDRTSPSGNKYFLSQLNWPWALNFTEQFDYPTEGHAINSAYNHFLEWAASGGALYTGWYKNVSGNRNASLIYTK
jgi:LruC domain-containing protein